MVTNKCICACGCNQSAIRSLNVKCHSKALNIRTSIWSEVKNLVKGILINKSQEAIELLLTVTWYFFVIASASNTRNSTLYAPNPSWKIYGNNTRLVQYPEDNMRKKSKVTVCVTVLKVSIHAAFLVAFAFQVLDVYTKYSRAQTSTTNTLVKHSSLNLPGCI